MIRTLLASLACLCVSAAAALAQADIHDPWDALLERHVTRGADGIDRVDYASWRADAADREALEAYIAALEALAVSTLPDAERFAVWANLYNAVTVRLILDEAPSDSIRQIRPTLFSIGPWGMELTRSEGRTLSLDNIEHDIMRVQFEAAMVHYAVNCASIGCPNIGLRAWRAATLDADLEAAARAYVNHPRGVTVTERGLEISRIYKWFEEDFGGNDAGVIAHLLRFAEPELAEQIRANPRIVRHRYDWSLNAPGN
ncbi:MAG: DUF547 domain-containing protein [Caulobacterales bacterium]|uniref:DUF547 domain-containing protein n=1 Tax=Glycocaulis sp. TaxID=1969725 RepID=UPI003FA10BA4